MNVWCHLPTIFKQRFALRRAGLIAICVALITTLFFVAPSQAAPGVNQTLSFQGRLSNSTGGIVPDGFYNIQFKIYQDGDGTTAGNSGGTLEWTETYINDGGTDGVQVKNGYFSVTLGSQNPFGSSVDWNQDTLWLSLNVAGSSASCTTFGSGTCTADGEMLPMKRLTSTPYALNSGMLDGRTSDGFIQNGTSPQTADFSITGTGAAATLQGTTSVLTPLLDRADSGTLTIGSVNASSITIGKAASNITTTVLGSAVFKPTTGNDSTTMFQLQRADGTAMLIADSTNQTITIGGVSDKTVISTATGQITKYGTARNTKKITLNAEYTGSVLDAGTGSNNAGTMTSSIDLTNRMNYYKWTTSQGTNQSYDVVVQVPLPTDFDGWASSNPLSISTYTSNTTNGTVTLEARDSSGTVQCNFVSVTPGSTSAWATNSSACTLSSGTYTAGDYITFRIRMQSPTGGDVRIGNINLSYLSKY